MKLTILHKGTTVVIDETNNKDTATMRWDDQNKQIQQTISSVINDINRSQQ